MTDMQANTAGTPRTGELSDEGWAPWTGELSEEEMRALDGPEDDGLQPPDKDWSPWAGELSERSPSPSPSPPAPPEGSTPTRSAKA